MFATLLSTTVLSALAIAGARAQSLTINTPAVLTQCEPATITWQAGTGPYSLFVVSASDPCDDELVDLGDFTATSATWTVNVTAGTSVMLSLMDSNDDEAWSSAVTIAAGSDSTCLSSSGSSAVGSSIAASAKSSAAAAATPAKSSSTSSVTEAAQAAGASASAIGAASGAPALRPSLAIGVLSVLGGALAFFS